MKLKKQEKVKVDKPKEVEPDHKQKLVKEKTNEKEEVKEEAVRRSPDKKLTWSERMKLKKEESSKKIEKEGKTGNKGTL